MLPNFSSLQQDLGSEIAAGDRGFGMGFCNGTSWEAGRFYSQSVSGIKESAFHGGLLME